MKNFIAACLVLSLGIILTYHLYLLWVTGSIMIVEPSKLILTIEMNIGLLITGFGLKLLVSK